MSTEQAAFFYNDFRDLLQEFHEAELSENRLAMSMPDQFTEHQDVASSN